MTESTIDMDRAMQGIDCEVIHWTKCSERMPPCDDREIFIHKIDSVEMHQTPANEIWYEIDYQEKDRWEWTPYSPEAWAELNSLDKV